MSKKSTIVGVLLLLLLIASYILVRSRHKAPAVHDSMTNDSSSETVKPNISKSSTAKLVNGVTTWDAILNVNSGGHSLLVVSVNQESGEVKLKHKKPGPDCYVTQGFTTITTSFSVNNSVTPIIETQSETYSCSL
jgi:hypothetical protein